MKIWIDTDTGTWGDTDTLVILEVSEERMEEIAEMSDTDRNDYGRNHGSPVTAAS